jgi:hypothetical protein
MADERRAMYDGFSDISKHSVEWVRFTKEFFKLAFAGGRREASCPCSRCENKRILSKYEMSAHLAKKGFLSNYIGREYDLVYEDPPPKVQNFYRLLAASEEKVHDGVDMTVL